MPNDGDGAVVALSVTLHTDRVSVHNMAPARTELLPIFLP